MSDVTATEFQHLVGLRLRAARRAAGFKKARELAAVLGIEENTLTTWERGTRRLDPLILPAFMQMTSVSPTFIYTGDLSREPYVLAQRLLSEMEKFKPLRREIEKLAQAVSEADQAEAAYLDQGPSNDRPTKRKPPALPRPDPSSTD